MKDPLLYILESLVCGGAFMLLYRTVIMQRCSFRFARGYLLSAALLSGVIPLLRIPVYPARTVHLSLPPSIADGITAEIVPDVRAAVLPDYIYLGIYSTVALLMTVMILREIIAIRRIRRRSTLIEEYGYPVYRSAGVGSPFSFGRSIYVGQGLEDREMEQIIAHESSHLRNGHPAEKGVMTVLRLLQWYNPFVWMAYRRLTEVHEYQADGDVLAAGYDITEYGKLILKQILGHNPDIASGLNNSLTKKRFVIMNKKKNMHTGVVRVASTVMLAGGLMMLFGFTRQSTVRTVDFQQLPTVEEVKATGYITTEPKSVKNGYQTTGGDPIWVVDGKEVPREQALKIVAGDIESMSVLKGEAAVEKYGDRAADTGVMIITTKKPRQADGPLTVILSQGETVTLEGENASAVLEKLDPDSIESIHVIKAGAAREKYGEGNQGVIEVRLKEDAETPR